MFTGYRNKRKDPNLIRVTDSSGGTPRHEGPGPKKNRRPGPGHDVLVDEVEDLEDEVDTGPLPTQGLPLICVLERVEVTDVDTNGGSYTPLRRVRRPLTPGLKVVLEIPILTFETHPTPHNPVPLLSMIFPSLPAIGTRFSEPTDGRLRIL